MSKLFLALAIFFLFGNVFALCNESQININTASLSELDNLYGIGVSKAQAIIDARPYNSVDDLINVKGIGSVTLEKIKEQGLACVLEGGSNSIQNNNSSNEVSIEPINLPNSQNQNFTDEETFLVLKRNNKTSEDLSLPISLTPKDIKTQNSVQNKETTDYSKYFFLFFCVFLVGLYILKFRKRKNEWKK